MFKHMTNMNAEQLLDAWRKAGMVKENEAARSEQLLQALQQEKGMPFYSRIMLGIGAFSAASSFFGFLITSGLINLASHTGMIFGGLICVGVALFLVKLSGNQENTAKIFCIQSSFCAMIVGKILFVTGIAGMFNGEGGWGVTLAAFIITAATYPVYRISLDRFLSVSGVFISLLVNIIGDRSLGISAEIALNLFFLIQMILAGILLTNDHVKRDYLPVAYAALFSLCVILIFRTGDTMIGLPQTPTFYSLTFINAVLTLSLIGLIVWAVGHYGKLKITSFAPAFLGCVALGVISAPGVLFSLCLMILGYVKHERSLLLTGLLLMPAFIFLYYYNLEISLMAKAGVLVGSGVILLIGRAYLLRKSPDREVV